MIVPLHKLPGFRPVGLSIFEVSSRDPVGICTDRELGVALGAHTDMEIEGREHGGVLGVDFSDAATRDRAARWLAVRVGLEPVCTAPDWSRTSLVSWQLRTPFCGQVVGTQGGCRVFHGDRARRSGIYVPELAGIDTDDDTRTCYALSLATVCVSTVCVAMGGCL